MGTDTFIRSSGRTIVFTSSFSKEVIKEELIYDMLYKEISGKINYYRRYWYGSGRSATDIIEVENQDFKEIYWNHKEKHEFKEYVLNLIKDNPKVYDKWESKSPFKLYNKIDKIIAEYNTL